MIKRLVRSRYLYIALASLIPLFFYINRFLLPDFAFDTVNYHVFNGERGLRNFLIPYSIKEFFPAGLHSFSPFLEFFSAFTRYLFGYRLGTLPGLLSYFLIIIYVYKTAHYLIPDFFSKANRSFAFLFFVNSVVVFELLVQVATYFVDTIHTMFVVIGFYYFTKFIKESKRNYALLASTVFGLSLLGKLTSFVFVIPFVLMLFLQLIKLRDWKTLVFSLVLLFLPFGVFACKIWLSTGNPIFPLYNSIFRSPYFAYVSFQNHNFGPRNITEVLFWPIISAVQKGRLGELEKYFYDYKLSLSFAIAVIFTTSLLMKTNKVKEVWLINISIFYFLSYYLWAYAFGYSRYGSMFEILAGIMLMVLYSKALYSDKALKIATLCLLLILTVQNYRILKVNIDNEYAWRSPMIRNFSVHLTQLRHLFDNKIAISSKIERRLLLTDVFVNCGMPGLGLYTLLNIDKPVIMLPDMSKEYQMTNAYYAESIKRLGVGKKGIMSFAAFMRKDGMNPNDAACLKTLSDNGAVIDVRLPVAYKAREGFAGDLVFGTINVLRN